MWRMPTDVCRSQTLATHTDNDRHTVDNGRSLVRSVLEEFGALRTGNVYITDNASNMKAAFILNLK